MSHFRFFFYASLAGCLVVPAHSAVSTTNARDLLRALPLHFEANAGQWNARVKYAARAGESTLLLTGREAVLRRGGSEVGLSLAGSDPAATVEGIDRLPSTSNYFLGRAPAWRTGVPHFARVRYREVYPGVDVVYYGNQNQLEYDLVLRPGAEPKRIRFQFRGAQSLAMNADGDLVVGTASGQFVQKKPVVYQETEGASERRVVAARYRVRGRHTATVELAAYDRSRPLTIDPVLVYSSLFGGSGNDSIVAVKADAAGMVYVAGFITTSDLSGTDSAYQTASGGGVDVFVAKIDPTAAGGRFLVYLTYIGGSGDEFAAGMTLDSAGNVYLTGSTSSTNFPLAGLAVQNALSGGSSSDAFALELKAGAQGSADLVYSTYLGGTDIDVGAAIDVDKAGNMYIAGTTRSGDFPLTGSAYAAERWGDQDAFIVKLDPNSSSLAYSSYLGGETIDEGRAVAVTPAGIVYFAGSTLSGQFPLAGLSYRDQLAGAVDIFLCQMDLTKSGTSSLLYATYIGGSGVEELRKIALDGQGKVLLTGYTLSTDFPVTGDAFQSSNKGGGDVFLMRFDPAAPPSAAVLYSTYLGGRGGDVAYDIAADAGSKVYLTGYTLSQDFPVTGDAVQLNWGGGIDVFVIALDLSKPGAGALVFGSYLGLDGVHVGYGVAASANGTIYAAGYTGIHNIQTTSGAVQPGFAGGLSDGFLVVIGPQ